ncbi:MAG: hypothetical protein JW892_08665 [Anaerolineae bacterium]|nr:hypothetical protein [Anaerolineae bacterium]
MKRRRILALLFFAVGAANLVRAAMGVTIAPTLAAWTLSLSPYAAAAFYLVWGLAFTGATWATCKATQPGKAALRYKALRWALPLAAGYQVSLWVLNLSTYRASYARSLWRRDLILSAVFLMAVALLNKVKPESWE